MAIKIKKKRPGGDELENPDIVLAASQETFGWLQEHRTLIFGGLGVFVLVIVAGSVVFDKRAESRASAAGPVLDALAAAIGDDTAGTGDVEARAQAVLTAAEPAIDEGGQVATTAGIITGAANLALGDPTSATVQYRAFASDLGPAEQAVAAFGFAASLADDGNLDDARRTLEEIALGSEALAYPAALQIARLTDAYGEPAAALAALREVVANHPGQPAIPEVENRIVQLEITLDVDPEPEEAEETAAEEAAAEDAEEDGAEQAAAEPGAE